MSENIVGSIYILTNPSFLDYVKIGYSKNVEERINKLNNSEAVPFGFKLYATYDVETQSADKVLSMDFNTYYLDMINNLTQNNIISVDSFLGVSKRFEINNESYKPSSGEATMIILDDVLKSEHDVYLLDEPEKSLVNA